RYPLYRSYSSSSPNYVDSICLEPSASERLRGARSVMTAFCLGYEQLGRRAIACNPIGQIAPHVRFAPDAYAAPAIQADCSRTKMREGRHAEIALQVGSGDETTK